MAITKVRVQINGVWTSCEKNTDGKWACSTTAPSTTSYTRTEKYYPVTVEVTNDAGTVVTFNNNSETIGTSLRLTVKETIKPVITLVTPTNGTRSRNNMQPITFKVTDETNGSGLNLGSVVLTLDSTQYKNGSTGMVVTDITNGKQFVYTPQAALEDGSHTISITAKDNDGNTAATVSASFTVDVAKPILTVTAPANNLITNKAACTLTGTTNDATSSPVTVTATLNGTDVGAITVESSGVFTKALTLKEGTNTIVVKSTDKAGNFTEVTRTVKLDTSVPKLTAATISPNPANASESVQIVLTIT